MTAALKIVRTRIAPTPSGYLHLGNAWSFVIAWLAARRQGGSIHLRIDDLDAARFREDYLEDIFASLQWLGLDWDSGPKDASEFNAKFSQRHNMDRYRLSLRSLFDKRIEGHPLVYACACSREQAKREAARAGTGARYAGTCRTKDLRREGCLDAAQVGPAVANGSGAPGSSNAEMTALRLHVTGNASVTVKDLLAGDLELHPAEDIGDFILWQKNREPAYQLASVLDDEALGINLIVRGMDLLPSTGAQALLARHLNLSGFTEAVFIHHGLLLEPDGSKISKSSESSPSAASLRTLRAQLGTPAPLVRYFARCLGIKVKGQTRFTDLLPDFKLNPTLLQSLDWPSFQNVLASM